MESQHDLISLFEHDLFEKPVSTFPDHALTRSAARFATHRILKMTLKSGALSVKATSRSSTARPQEKAEIPIPLPLLRANGSRECAPDDRSREAISARYGLSSSPQAAREWLCPDRSISTSRRACRKRPRGSRPCSSGRPWRRPLP